MKILSAFLALMFWATGSAAQEAAKPTLLIGDFTDDYGIRYQITDSVWTQLPTTKYHIIKWNVKDQYLIAKNDSANKTDKGLYTRIDYMQFENMAPYLWGFCLTLYDASNKEAAEATAAADRKNPRKGCNGYPFSRMKKIEEKGR
ncbi:MAG: hypothetical protein V4722_25380 [Bacteroidota bacterium]